MKSERVTRENLRESYERKMAEKAVQLPSPEDCVIDLSILTPEAAKTRSEEFRNKAAPALAEEIKRTLSWIESVSKEDRETQEIIEFAVKQSGKQHPCQRLQEKLNHEFVPYRRVAWTALFEYFFSKEVKTREDIQSILNFLCQQGYLLKCPEASFFKAYGQGYALPEKAAAVLTGQPEFFLLRKSFTELLHRVREAERKNLLSQGNLSRQEFLAGKPGIFALEVPADKEGRPGGTLLVESDGRRIFPLKGVGGFQKAIEEAKEQKVFLLLQSLSRQSPPFVKGLDAKKGAKIALLWHLLKRGISQTQEQTEIQNLRERMKSTECLVSPKEFFLEKKPGVAFVEYPGTWIWKDTSKGTKICLDNLFFLIERQRRENQSTIRLVEIPPWLEEFFSDCRGEYDEGEKFETIPQPLQAVLQRTWGQIQKRSQIQV